MTKYFSLFIAILFGITNYAQVNNTSPYSYFGIGETAQQNSVSANSMGGLSLTTESVSELNFSNPAANAALKLTTFTLASQTHFFSVDNGSVKENTSNTSLSYLALGFPVSKKAGVVIGLQPNTNVGYSINEEILNNDDELVEANIYKGSGGTSRLFGSFGYKILEDLNIGIEGEYIFGKIENNIINQRKDVTYNTYDKRISNLSGSSLKLGALYKRKINDNLDLKTALSVKFENTLDATSEEYLYSFTYDAYAQEVPQDTLFGNSDMVGEIKRPLSFAGGIGIGKSKKWYAGIEYSSQQAMEFDNSILKGNNKIKYNAKSKLNIGGYWIPKANSITSYWQRVIYRAGLRFENSGLSISPTGNLSDFEDLNDFGISFGLGLPIGNQMSKVNLGFEYGNRGNTTNGLIKENYFNLRVGLDLTDKWFHKREID